MIWHRHKSLAIPSQPSTICPATCNEIFSPDCGDRTEKQRWILSTFRSGQTHVFRWWEGNISSVNIEKIGLYWIFSSSQLLKMNIMMGNIFEGNIRQTIPWIDRDLQLSLRKLRKINWWLTECWSGDSRRDRRHWECVLFIFQLLRFIVTFLSLSIHFF